MKASLPRRDIFLLLRILCSAIMHLRFEFRNIKGVVAVGSLLQPASWPLYLRFPEARSAANRVGMVGEDRNHNSVNQAPETGQLWCWLCHPTFPFSIRHGKISNLLTCYS